MKTKWLTTTLVIFIALLFLATPCWAKAKGYCFVIGYSYKLKKLYSTPIFMVKVRNVSYSATEYVAEVELIQKMESQFQNHLAGTTGENPADFTVTARGAYKNQAFAAQAMAREKAEYAKRKFEVLDLSGFAFKK